MEVWPVRSWGSADWGLDLGPLGRGSCGGSSEGADKGSAVSPQQPRALAGGRSLADFPLYPAGIPRLQVAVHCYGVLISDF